MAFNILVWLGIEALADARKIYEGLGDYLKPQSVPAVILILANYQYKAAFAADSEINMMACLTEIMMEAEFK